MVFVAHLSGSKFACIWRRICDTTASRAKIRNYGSCSEPPGDSLQRQIHSVITKTRTANDSQRQLRSSSNIQIPSARTNIYQNFFIPRTSKDWNSLPMNVPSNPSLPQFKRYLDKNKSKVPPYYYIGDRRCQILHARLRLGCISLKADLFNNHLSETDKCTCGKPETAPHYFLECVNFRAVHAATSQSLTY